MKSIKLKNDRLRTILSSTTEYFYSDGFRELSKKQKERKDNLIKEYHPTSYEYLFAAFKHPLNEYGYPRALLGASASDMLKTNPKDNNLVAISKITARLKSYLGTQREALSMYYPEDGYIGWHHNGNAPGYNILVSYSMDGDGGFSFWDYETKSIKTIKDSVGWNVKVGYYPNERKEPDRVYWHMAKTKKPRVSIAWVIDQKDMWKNMIDEITQGDYDHNDILSQ